MFCGFARAHYPTRRAVRVTPVTPRKLANGDTCERLGHYLSEGSKAAALGVIDPPEQEYAHEPNLHGLRCWPPKRFPYLTLCVGHASQLAVRRVWHETRDIPACLQYDNDG